MATVLIVAPVFALIAAGYASVLFRFVSETAHKGISEFAFSIAIPALLFRTIVVVGIPRCQPLPDVGRLLRRARHHLDRGAGDLGHACCERREDREDGVVFAIGSVYGNIVMLGIPLVLSALGNEAAGPMSLILSVNTPLLWLCGILQMELVSRKRTGSLLSVIRPVLADLARNPLMLAIGFGVVWRLTGLGLQSRRRQDDRAAGAGGIAGGADRARHQPVPIRGQGRDAERRRDERAQAAGDAGGARSCWQSCSVCRRSRPA